MSRVAVVLSGCGVYDGAEINEAVLSLLCLEQQGASYQCFAPDIEQMHVINHLTGEPAEGETRNVLVEAARIARGNVLDLGAARVEDFDALLVPGGFGAAKNLCNFAVAGAEMTIDDDFLARSVQMAIDGQEPNTLGSMLNTEIDYIRQRHLKVANIFISIGTYAPAMGMVGTLIGLVQMLQNLNDPSRIGPAMAVALLTTFYGAVIANVICLPIAGKLKNRSESEILVKTLIIEGMQSILSGENPRLIEQKLHAYISPKMRATTFDR